MGFPPFYVSMSVFSLEKPSEAESDREHVIWLMLPPTFVIIILMTLAFATGWGIFFAGGGCVALWAGFQLRQDLFKLTGGPLPWLSSYWTHRWPMLVFDVWTIGLSAFFALFPLL